MRTFIQLISWIALAGTLVPAGMYLAGTMALPMVKTCMLVATVVWFVTVPLWMDRQKP